ncbi:MAG: hypothetical protein H0V09_04955 [Gemmatimonadetes bacterium]|nr:hypothetical protein [Gemmatimonadota bacterium]
MSPRPGLPRIRIPHIPFRLRILVGCIGIFGGFALLVTAFATHSLLLTFLALGGIGQGVGTLLFPYSAYHP